MSRKSLRRLEYHDTELARAAAEAVPPAPVQEPPPGVSEDEVARRMEAALQQAEARWKSLSEQGEAQRRTQVQSALQAFAAERGRYFQKVETEVVQLALAIARKILGREAAMDPDLVAAMVRIALDRMGAGSSVTLRVPAAELTAWQSGAKLMPSPYDYKLEADPALSPGDCLVETDLGSAHFGLEAQLKQVEEGMLDLLQLRPATMDIEMADAVQGDLPPLAAAGEGMR